MLHIWDDPWIPTLPTYRPPLEYKTEHSPIYVHQLMSSSNNCWDMEVLTTLFPYSISKEILKIHLPSQLGQDSLIWTPSSTGDFSIKSAYRHFFQHRFALNSDVSRADWRLLWKSDLHPRHKHFLWKVVVGLLSTSMRLASILHLPATTVVRRTKLLNTSFSGARSH